MGKFDLQIDGKNKSITKGNTDWYYGGGEEAWNDLVSAKAGVPSVLRSGKTVGIIETGKIVEYIWHPDDITDPGLILKNTGGDYLALINKPTIPTNTSDLVNDGANGTNPFITASDLNPQRQIISPTDFTAGVYTVTDSDNGYVLFINNGADVVSINVSATITKANFTVGFIQEGTGEVTFTNSGGTTLLSAVGSKSKGIYYQTFIERKLSTSTFYLLGNTKI
jgi:hypothetical protein